MKTQDKGNKVLIIQGPNMNLLGYRYKETKTKITLDRVNVCLRKEAKKRQLQLTIIQTNDESRAATVLQKYRNKIFCTLLFPGPWQQSGHVLKDTLELLKIPYVTISLGEDTVLLKGLDNIKGDILLSCEKAMKRLSQLI